MVIWNPHFKILVIVRETPLIAMDPFGMAQNEITDVDMNGIVDIMDVIIIIQNLLM